MSCLTRRVVAIQARLIRTACLLSTTALAGLAVSSAEAAKFGVVVNQVGDPTLNALAIPDNAATAGMWSAVRNWPMNAITLGLLPTGKVVSYGTRGGDPAVQDGRTFDVWDPVSGFDGGHLTIDGVVGVNSFCAAQAFQADGSLLISGGIFDSGANKGSVVLNSSGTGISTIPAKLANDRYYSTMVTLPDGRQMIMGGSYPYLGGFADPQGSIDRGYMTGMTPEIYANGVWTSLLGAKSRDAFGPENSRWWFPRAWVAPNGKVFGITSEKMWFLDPSGNGSVQVQNFKEPQRNASSALDAPNVGPVSTAVMYETGKILQVGGNSYDNGAGFISSSRATTIDITSGVANVADTAPMSVGRGWANATVLPTGQVAVTGGSRFNDHGGDQIVKLAEIWDPRTGKWTQGASNGIYRGYHSSAILMQNGTVLVAGGGAPGPVNNSNAEIFYPPYLFANTNGKPALAPRPQIVSLSSRNVAHGGSIQFELASRNGLSQVVFVGLSATTHSFNSTQRRHVAGFSASGDVVTVQGPASGSIAPPGYYQLVAIDSKGVPSPGVIVAVGPGVAAPTADRTPVVPETAGGGTASAGTGPNGNPNPGTGTGSGSGTGNGGGTGTAPNGGAGTAGLPDGGMLLKAQHSGLCLTVPAGNNADGAPVTQQACTGAAEQTWTPRIRSGGAALVNKASGKCLDMSLEQAPKAGTQVYQWGCHDGTNQAWTTKSQGTGVALASAMSGLCLDVLGGSVVSGGGAIVWTCHGGPNQTFSAPSTGGLLKAQHSGLCLAVPAGNNADGAPITQQACTGAAEQTWTPRIRSGGIALVNKASGKCLDMSLEQAPKAGTQVYQWGCHDGTNQAWTTRSQGTGVALASAMSGMCVDILGASAQVGGGTVVWTCHGGPNQTFSAP